MDIQDLNKSQLILLAVLLSFITSIATGITTVTLMQQAPASVTVPVTRIVRETVEKVVPAEVDTKAQALSEEEKKLLADLKAIKPLTVTLYVKKDSGDKILGTGLFLGNNKVVIASLVPQPGASDVYMVRSVLGEQKVSKVTAEKDFTIVEFVQSETTEPTLPQSGETPPPSSGTGTPAPATP